MKNFILFIIFIFIHLCASAQLDTENAIKGKSITREKQDKSSVIQSRAELRIEDNSRETNKEGLTVRQITVQRSTTPDYGRKARAELATKDISKKSSNELNQLRSFQITLQPHSKPSGINAMAKRVE